MGFFFVMFAASILLDTLQMVKKKVGKRDKVFYYCSMAIILTIGTLYYSNVFDIGIIDYINK